MRRREFRGKMLFGREVSEEAVYCDRCKGEVVEEYLGHSDKNGVLGTQFADTCTNCYDYLYYEHKDSPIAVLLQRLLADVDPVEVIENGGNAPSDAIQVTWQAKPLPLMGR